MFEDDKTFWTALKTMNNSPFKIKYEFKKVRIQDHLKSEIDN